MEKEFNPPSKMKTICFFCNKEIIWEIEYNVCQECGGTGIGCAAEPCPFCRATGWVEDDSYEPCCKECGEKEYGEVEG